MAEGIARHGELHTGHLALCSIPRASPIEESLLGKHRVLSLGHLPLGNRIRNQQHSSRPQQDATIRETRKRFVRLTVM